MKLSLSNAALLQSLLAICHSESLNLSISGQLTAWEKIK